MKVRKKRGAYRNQYYTQQICCVSCGFKMRSLSYFTLLREYTPLSNDIYACKYKESCFIKAVHLMDDIIYADEKAKSQNRLTKYPYA